MSRIRFARNNASEGLNALVSELNSRGLNVAKLRNENSSFRARAGDVLINWGAARETSGFLNRHAHKAVNKRTAFNYLQSHGVPIPDYTSDGTTVLDWLNDGSTVVARTTTRGSSGNGIILLSNPEEPIVRAPLYTRYIKKAQEYRVHVFMGEVIAVQRKARKLDVAEPNWQIRTNENGFTFAREGVTLPEVAKGIAVDAVRALGLQFGAVDIIYNQHRDAYYVLEINTAPGLEGQTVSDYADAIQNLVRG